MVTPDKSVTEPESTNKTDLEIKIVRVVRSNANGHCEACLTPVNSQEASFASREIAGTCENNSAWSGWSHMYGQNTLVIKKGHISEVGTANPNYNGLITGKVQYKSDLWCSGRVATNEILYGYYKITDIKDNNDPKAIYNGTSYGKNDTSRNNPIKVRGGKIQFKHWLARDDGWGNPSVEDLTDVYMRQTRNDSANQIISSDSSWKPLRLNKMNNGNRQYTEITDEIDISNITITEATKVCSEVTYRKVKGLLGHTATQDSATNTNTSKICVWIDENIYLDTDSASYVNNGIDNNNNSPVHAGGNNTVESWGGSGGGAKTYTYSFTHKLQLKGEAGYAGQLQYYVTQTDDGNNVSVQGGGSSSSPNTANINSVGSNSTGYTTVATYNGSWSPINAGESTSIICQTIHFRPKQIKIRPSSGVSTISDNSWQTSTVCTRVKRRQGTPIEISADSHYKVDGGPLDTNDHPYSTNSTRGFQFIFNITTPNNRSLSTTYRIQRLIYNSGDTENWANATIARGPITVNAPVNNITDTFNVLLDEGKSKTVCERIILNPYRYTIEYKADGSEDGTTPTAGDGTFAKKCVTVYRPSKTWRDDGEITVYSQSSGELNNIAQTGGIYQATGAYLIKTRSADITYTHKFWREAEKHTGDGVHQAAVRSPEEDVTIGFRFDKPEVTFSATSIERTNNGASIPTAIIKTNTSNNKHNEQSNTSDPLKNTNTAARAEKVGVTYSYCQAANYLSKTYTLRGQYWEVDGAIFDSSPELQAVQTPVPKNTVGKSDPAGCVNVLRPYNFKVDDITIINSPSEPVQSGGTVDVSFQIDVTKNDPSY
ncbi:hypothetical protein IKG31_02870, partial [Candidatus Saccharibacteria bacterium]|nr:hypothetical protein [Candidatus Saccharibacteria bacterium]